MAHPNDAVRMRPCTIDEFEDLLGYLNAQFTKNEPRWFARHKEHIFLRTPESVKHHRLVTDEQGIAGIVGIYPFSIKVGKARLAVGGVGSVSVRGDLRGRGLMSGMLHDTVRELERGRYDISWLGGDRFRYGNYGWEHGGRVLTFVLARRDLVRRYPDIRPARLRRAAARDIPDLARLYRRIGAGVIRSADIWPVHLRTKGFGFRITGTGRNAAYLAHGAHDPAWIPEINGSPDTVIALLLGYMRARKADWVRVSMPDTTGPLVERLFEASASYSCGHCNQYRVVDTASAWKKLVPEIAARAESAGVKDTSRTLAGITREPDRRLILGRALGFLDRVPALPRRLKAFEWVRPVGWWMSPVDGV